MASGASTTTASSEVKSREHSSSNDSTLDSKSSGALTVSPLPSDNKTVQLVLTQTSGTQQLAHANANSRAPVVIASVSPSDQTKKSSLVARLAQSSGEHLTGGQVAKICGSTPQMSNTGAGSGKPKAFAAMMASGVGDNPPSTTSPKKQSAKKGAAWL